MNLPNLDHAQPLITKEGEVLYGDAALIARAKQAARSDDHWIARAAANRVAKNERDERRED